MISFSKNRLTSFNRAGRGNGLQGLDKDPDGFHLLPNGDQIRTVRAKDGDITPGDLALLNAARGLYESSFPNENERVPFEDLLTQIREDGLTWTVQSAASAPLSVKGLLIQWHYHDDKAKKSVSLLGYIATAPEKNDAIYDKQVNSTASGHQGQGIGTQLYRRAALIGRAQAQRLGYAYEGTFFEVNPLETKNDVMNPAARQKWYRDRGAVKLPLFYWQPPTSDDTPGCRLDLHAMRDPVTGKYPAKAAIELYLTSNDDKEEARVQHALRDLHAPGFDKNYKENALIARTAERAHDAKRAASARKEARKAAPLPAAALVPARPAPSFFPQASAAATSL